MSLSLKIAVAVALLIIFVASAALTFSAFSGGEAKPGPLAAKRATELKTKKFARLEAEIRRQKRANLLRAKRLEAEAPTPGVPKAASAGSNGTKGQSRRAASPRASSAGFLTESFSELEEQISGSIGVAFAPLGSNSPEQIGSLSAGHAWSSFKVPITVTLMEQQNDSLSSEQQSLAAAAITASDNDAAAALFDDLESTSGGEASAAIEAVLAQSGGPTEVATAPPPPGAVSSWGQTNWTLAASTDFYGALACGRLLSGSGTALVVGLMEQVIPEQQWGLGQASFPAGTQVAFKAGWGPDGSESGPYLVRQAGILRTPSGGAVVTIAAQDESGSFEAGVADLDAVADWVAQNVPFKGSC